MSKNHSKKNRQKKTSVNSSVLTGIVKRNPDGFGFFICDKGSIDDVYVPREEMFGVFSNDRVELKVNRRSGRLGKSGKVLRVVERASGRFVGRLFFNESTGECYLKDSAHNWGQILYVENDQGAKPGELVLVEVTRFPEPEEAPQSQKRKDWKGTFLGKVVSVIGSEVDPNTDNIRILHELSVPVEFSEKALDEARAHGSEVLKKDKSGRRDLRKLNLITIDGITAKDFDDAIYVEEDTKGFKLIVAIADVSHYVKKGSPLDREAYEKGTSVYLANYVCPMLPEELSNGLCSLNPHVDRLCFACEMRIDLEGQVQNYNFFEGLMRSHSRVTYGEAQEVIEGGESEHPKKTQEVILKASKLSEILNEKRMKEGSIDFNVPAVKVLVNDLGEPTDLVSEERIWAHRLIEELMLITNVCASKYLNSKKTSQLYRIHESPEKENLDKLDKILEHILKRPFKKIRSNLDFQKISHALQGMDDHVVAEIAQSYVLRSMKQAQYSEKQMGHFGLNFDFYAHFTSPIRRYPDLVIHRQIKSLLSKNYSPYGEDDVASMGAVLSAAEQRAVKAERKVVSVKKARFFENHVGKEYEGYISSVVKFGTFVTLREYPLDGLIKVDDLGGDYFAFDEEAALLKGKRSGKVFAVGDKVRISVDHVSVQDGRIDFSLISHEQSEFLEKEPKPRKRQSKSTEGRAQQKKKAKKKSKKGKSKGSSKKGGAAGMFSASSSSRGISFGKGKKKRRRK